MECFNQKEKQNSAAKDIFLTYFWSLTSRMCN